MSIVRVNLDHEGNRSSEEKLLSVLLRNVYDSKEKWKNDPNQGTLRNHQQVNRDYEKAPRNGASRFKSLSIIKGL